VLAGLQVESSEGFQIPKDTTEKPQRLQLSVRVIYNNKW